MSAVAEGDMVTTGYVETADGYVPGVLYLYKSGSLWLVQDAETCQAIEDEGGLVHVIRLKDLHDLTLGGEIPAVTDPAPDGMYRVPGVGGGATLYLCQSGVWSEVDEDEESAIRRFGRPTDLFPNKSGSYGIGVAPQ
jgi:hypothetical protein